MTTKPVLRQFVFNKIPYYTDGGECYDLGSEGDFGHYAALNFHCYILRSICLPLGDKLAAGYR